MSSTLEERVAPCNSEHAHQPLPLSALYSTLALSTSIQMYLRCAMLSNDLLVHTDGYSCTNPLLGRSVLAQIAQFLSELSITRIFGCIWELGDHAALGASMLTDILPLHAALAYVPRTVNLMVVRLRKESQVWCPKYHPNRCSPCALRAGLNRPTRAPPAPASHRLLVVEVATQVRWERC